MRDIDKARWPRLSPLLDELLDLDAPARAARLAQLRAADPELAADLASLLARDEALAQQAFLDQPALPTLSSASLLATGQTLGAYTLEREIGQGGMGSVWLARRTDGRFEGQVAIKFLTAGLLGQGDAGRFAREGQILGRLAHPHIARLIDAGVAPDGRQPYLVLEYIDGQPIDRYCSAHQLDTPARVRLFIDVLAAVAHAHNRLILHRDLKPSNILVDTAGEVKLLDFGIAKLLTGDATQPAGASDLTQAAGNAYTLQYAAPEQVQGGDVTTATDVYALGVLLYLLLGERHPTMHSVDTPLERLRTVVEVEPKRMSDAVREQGSSEAARRARELRGDLDTIVARALKKAPAERYANAAAMADDLRRWLAHEPIAARPDSALYVVDRFIRRNRLAVFAGSLSVLMLILLTVFSLTEAWRADRAEKQAQVRRQQADDLLSYMLGDFADKLRPVGRLELLDSVGSKALNHLASDDDKSTPFARLQRAKALTVIGEVRVSKRELDGALDPLRSAQRLLAGDPPTPALVGEWRKAQGAAAFWIGHVHYTRREFAAAKVAMEQYREVSQRWLDAMPGNSDALVELSYATTNLGTSMLDSGDLVRAAEYFRQSILLKTQVLNKPELRQKPSVQMELANSMSWLGTTLLWQGETTRAHAIFMDALTRIMKVREAAPGEGTWKYREALMRRWVAQSALLIPDLPQAETEARLAADLLRDLVRQAPDNQNWAMELISSEATALTAKVRPLPIAERLRRLRELLVRLDALDDKGGTAMALRRLPERARLQVLEAQAWMELGQADRGFQVLHPLEERLLLALKSRPQDLKLNAGLAEVRAGLIKATQGSKNVKQHQALCEESAGALQKLTGLLMVHQEITQAWVEAQSCLGQGRDKNVSVAKHWLTRDR